MLSSAAEQRSHHSSQRISHNNNNKSLNRIYFSSSPPPPASSESSTSSPTSQLRNTHPRTMEEVWRDISLANLQDNPLSINTQHNNHHHRNHMSHEPRIRTIHQSHNRNANCIFQDFLNRPLNNQEAPTSLIMNGCTTTTATGLCGSPLPPPATVLSLNSGAGFEFLDNPDPLVAPTSLQTHHQVSSLNTPFEALVTSAGLGCFGKKRGQDSDGRSGDRRHKRMIKNRESAARSRARKQECATPLPLP